MSPSVHNTSRIAPSAGDFSFIEPVQYFRIFIVACGVVAERQVDSDSDSDRSLLGEYSSPRRAAVAVWQHHGRAAGREGEPAMPSVPP